MYISLFNQNNFPYASFSCDVKELESNIENMDSWLKNRGYAKPYTLTLGEEEIWKSYPEAEYMSTFYEEGEPSAHVYSANGCYFAISSEGERILAADRLEMTRKLNSRMKRR